MILFGYNITFANIICVFWRNVCSNFVKKINLESNRFHLRENLKRFDNFIFCWKNFGKIYIFYLD